jgi:hypothetical protein
MKKTILLLFIIIFSAKSFAIDITADLFTYDEAKVEKQFEELDRLETFLKSKPELLDWEYSLNADSLIKTSNLNLNIDLNHNSLHAPGKIPSFWFAFTLSAIGTYTIYGVAAGPIAVLIVHYSSGKDKTERKKAIWGCATGTLIGAGIKYAVYKLG